MTPSKKVLLAILAHPDDESFGPGGTLAKYALEGVEVHYLCGTRGEHGSSDAEHLQGYASTGDMRWAELTAAAKELGLAGIHHVGFQDSGMAGSESNQHPQALSAQPVEVVAARIAHFVRQLKPQVIMTHDTIGGYRHPDHIMLNKATLHFVAHMREPNAFPDPEGLPNYYPQKVVYAIFDRRFLKTAVRFLPLFGQDPTKFGRNKDVNLMSFVDVDFPVHYRIPINAEAAERQSKASACHKSQLGGGPPRRGIFGMMMRLSSLGGRRDTFSQAYPEVPANQKMDNKDLFEGVK
jgi:N-acetyl-1-D-myo-inositol-2-amino-2-deoxy-alpha-D-glucopyranoside deacetylase/mycothiol S-conjugate amidase